MKSVLTVLFLAILGAQSAFAVQVRSALYVGHDKRDPSFKCWMIVQFDQNDIVGLATQIHDYSAAKLKSSKLTASTKTSGHAVRFSVNQNSYTADLYYNEKSEFTKLVFNTRISYFKSVITGLMSETVNEYRNVTCTNLKETKDLSEIPAKDLSYAQEILSSTL